MGPEDAFRNGKRKVRELCGPDARGVDTVISSVQVWAPTIDGALHFFIG